MADPIMDIGTVAGGIEWQARHAPAKWSALS